MATSTKQRIGIWAIAVFMAVGTVGSFAMIVLANSNAQRDEARVKELTAQYQEDTKKQQTELSGKYFGTVSEYMSRPAAFSADDVTELTHEDLVVGDGETLTAESSFTAYYIGWNVDGEIFDGSVDGETLKAPFEVTPGGVIEGWTKGVEGMKVGGVRELSIPASLAYGETGSGELIQPNMPIKFVVFVIPTPTPVEMPQELVNYYTTGRLQ